MRTLATRLLDGVEKAGNQLPHPFWLFLALIALVSLLSAALSAAGLSTRGPPRELAMTAGQPGRPAAQAPFVVTVPAAVDQVRIEHRGPDGSVLASETRSVEGSVVLEPGPPGTARIHVVAPGAEIVPRSLIGAEALAWWVLHLVENFVRFEPLGLVLVMLMGVSVAEGTGLVTAVMRGLATTVPVRFVTPALFAAAACGNIGSDAGVVVVPPLAAAIFRALGRNPVAGLLVGYVGATAGFTANLFPAGTDVLAMALTNAATGGEPPVGVLSNWYFMATSVFLLAGLGTFVTHRVVEPRLPPGSGPSADGGPAGLDPSERRGLVAAAVAGLALTALWLAALLPDGAPLRHPDEEQFWRSPFFQGLVPILFTLFLASGVAYGRAAGTLRRPDELLEHMTEAMRRMAPYIVLVLAISQFTAAFKYSRLDGLVAVEGARLLGQLGFEQWPLPFFVAFVGVVAVANLFMGSASAKWAIFAPVFVPMFLTLGFHPAFTQLLYRLGDSITNCVSPLYPFFPLLLGWVAAEDPTRARVGTVLALLVPYAGILLAGWLLLALAWYGLDLPLGPGAPIRL